MTLYTNKFRNFSNVRTPFISNDDTALGIMDILKVGDTKFAELFGHAPNPPGEDSDDKGDDYEYYDDIPTDVPFRFRQRPLVSDRLEKLDQAKKKRAKMKNIKWETSRDPLSQEDVEDLFSKKEIKSNEHKNKVSKLTELIQNYSSIPENPYVEYGKFDGSWHYTVPTKSYKIYITILPPDQRDYPMEVCCVSSAKIHELIGFILFKFSSQYGATNLLPVSYYNLYITEDDGEVDRDLPCLDRREPSAKFGFTYLGLVQEDHPCDPDDIPAGISHIMSIEEELEQIRIKKNPNKAKQEEERRMENDIKAIERNNRLMEAPLYRSFRASMITKIKLKIEVNIGVSWQRIEIDPVLQKTPRFLPFKQKALCYSMDNVVCCYIMDMKRNKLQFRIVHCTENGSSSVTSPSRGYRALFAISSSLPRSLKFWSTFKHIDFEADIITGKEIVGKIESILELKSGNSDYKLNRKFAKRKIFSSAL